MDGWVGTDEAAELLGIKRRSVYTYAQRLKGFPQPVHIGRTVLWEKAALLAWRKDHPTRKPTTRPRQPAGRRAHNPSTAALLPPATRARTIEHLRSRSPDLDPTPAGLARRVGRAGPES